MAPWLASGAAVSALLAGAGVVHAQAPAVLSIDNDDAIRKSAAMVAEDMMAYYHGDEPGQIPGILPGPPPGGDYYWWEGGAMWGTLIDYWHLTGDSKYNKKVMEAMLFQVGPDNNYMPPNQTASLGNDDQGFWGLAAMLAAENKFPDPPSDKPQWLALAQAVWNTQASPDRHDKECNGGLRWQIPFANNGYDYKNSIANGIFFNMGARLARYTKNETYAKHAQETWNWEEGVGLLDSQTYAVYDGGHVEKNCTDINKAEFSYNNAIWMQGAAFMWNHTEDEIWKTRTQRLADHGLKTFFPQDVMVEISCESHDSCSTDMLSFKGYFHRWYAMATQIAPFLADKVLPALKTSTEAAVKQCVGGDNGRQCGFQWASGKFDGLMGAGQEMNVVGAVSSLLIGHAKPPVTKDTGGTSKGDPNAGVGGGDIMGHDKPITTADRAGAGILTAVILGSAAGMFSWMSFGS